MMNYYKVKSNNLLLMLRNLLKLAFLLICAGSLPAQEKTNLATEQQMKSSNRNSGNLQPHEMQDANNDLAVYQAKESQISTVKNMVIIILGAALVGVSVFYNNKQKKQFAKFKGIIRNQKKVSYAYASEMTETEDFSNISVVEAGQTEEIKKRTDSLMTSETETKLLEFLGDFEKGNLYNNKNMSLPFLAGALNTNTKYLSYVINQHKSADFKTYINRLRINYIVHKLINDEKYRQYKIRILADECGFSSHSKFASVFKAVTDFSPSAFIKHLDEEKARS